MNGVPWWFRSMRLESLDPDGALSRAIPAERIVGCVIHLAASTPEPGVVSHNMGTKLIVGEPGGRNTARTQRIAEALMGAGFEVVVSDSIEKDFWVKLLGNVSFNPVSALTVSTADRLIEDGEVKRYMVQIMREVLEIGRAVGLPAAFGGLPLDTLGATAWGLLHCAQAAAPFASVDLKGARVVVQGFGAVGRHSARFLVEHGAKLVGASDSTGTIVNPNGLDVPALERLKQEGRGLADLKGAQKLEREGMHAAARLAAGAVAHEAAHAEPVHDALGDDGAGRIVRAEKQDVQWTI